uniref:Biogenesis of lysosome-related organelles complex 1 subunit 3 n=1 Tax=Pelodiscus sinensis TaxID=13735 RepID=K7EXD7_PELSI|nr:biogenesis of lysosome-related organelles complex 1 subunit 3 [Pelodiscus sinensis]|eukprot:XP_006115559.1 biogenesis of lysosome-related organelles complex 1 subunit 3 [Pelodiscus sinensis]
MAAPQCRTVIQGEASETDSDEEVYLSSVPQGPCPSLSGVKVLGEASETDDEDEGSPSGPEAKSQLVDLDLPPLIVLRKEEPRSPVGVEEKPALRLQPQGRYSTLLQQKLAESNARLHGDVSCAIKQVYHTATKELAGLTAQLSASQSGIIGASHHIRLVLDDLRAVADKMDIITSCSLLPDIQIELPPA